jgi:elongation factor Ts
VLLEVNSETDFVGKNPEFRAFVLDIAKTIAANDPADVEALASMKLAGGERTVEENRQDKILSCGENLSIRRFTRIAGNPAVISYIHMGGAVGVLVEFKADAAAAAAALFKEMSKNLAMQVAAMSPLYLSREGVPADALAEKKKEFLEQLAEDPKMEGKPEKVLEGVIRGRIEKYLAESCLMEQPYIKAEGKELVKHYVADVVKALGADVEIAGFVRYAKGENLQKREDDFAAEVAAAAGL